MARTLLASHPPAPRLPIDVGGAEATARCLAGEGKRRRSPPEPLAVAVVSAGAPAAVVAREAQTWRILPATPARGGSRSTRSIRPSRHWCAMIRSAPEPAPTASRNAASTAVASSGPTRGWTSRRSRGWPSSISPSMKPIVDRTPAEAAGQDLLQDSNDVRVDEGHAAGGQLFELADGREVRAPPRVSMGQPHRRSVTVARSPIETLRRTNGTVRRREDTRSAPVGNGGVSAERER